jgi:DNA-binding CsgD family transcriptional regulator
MAGEREYSTGSGSVISEAEWPRLQAALRLSERELQIVRQVLEDRKEESIAYELGISPHTVNTYLQRLYAKLRVASRAQLIVRVLSEHILFLNGQSLSTRADELVEAHRRGGKISFCPPEAYLPTRCCRSRLFSWQMYSNNS